MQTPLLVDLQNALIALALITPRTFVIFAILPGFGARTLTGIMRTAVAIGVVLPAALPAYLFVRDTPPDVFLALMLSVKEAVVGLLLGVLLAVPMWVTQSIGGILDTQRAAVQVQSNNQSIDQDASALGGMLLQAVVVVLIQAGLFMAAARIILDSYGLWPPFSLMPPYEIGQRDVLIKRMGEFFWHLIVYGAPVIIPLLLIDFGFALLGIFAGNLQVSSASAPIKALTGLFVLLVYWATFSHYVAGDFSRMLDLIPTLIQAQGVR